MDKNIEKCLQFSLIRIGQKDIMQKPARISNLENTMVHLWTARYTDLETCYPILFDSLNQTEREQASTFRKPADTRHFILRHGVLRFILGYYTLTKPGMVALVTGKNGKPELNSHASRADISFNLSHTSDMVLIGITKKRRIGVDIVKMDPSYRFLDTAEYLLTPAEKINFQRLDPAMRCQVFFRIWALKEAILKATGSTLAMMEKTDISEIIEDIYISLEYSLKFLGTYPPFFIWQFNCGSGHYGALAVDAGNFSEGAGYCRLRDLHNGTFF